MKIITRAEWDGPSGPIGSKMSAPASSVTAHHSYSPALPASASAAVEKAAMQGIQHYHRNVQGWAGIGYNFCIAQSGRVYEARGWQRVGAHAGTTPGNRTSIGVCFLIDGTKDAPSPAAMASFYALRMVGERDGYLRVGHALKLHRDWKQTSCPGDVAAAALRARNGDDQDAAPELLRRGMRGNAVLALQKRLVELGYMSAEQMATGPGTFGPATEASVRQAQRALGVVSDGLVGAKTRAALNL